jgi:hypothetical protein
LCGSDYGIVACQEIGFGKYASQDVLIGATPKGSILKLIFMMLMIAKRHSKDIFFWSSHTE